MPIYGGPDIAIEYTFIAVRPFTAEQPIGSGILVTYQPGDPFPGEEWGQAAHNLVEVGKAVRLAVNVGSPAAPVVSVPPEETELTVQEVNEITSPEEVTSYPFHAGGGWWELSDGTKVRGEEAALEAETALHEELGDE